MRPPSIRARLARAMLAWSVLWTVALALAIGFIVQVEVEELLDDMLQASAEALAVPLSRAIDPTPDTPPAGATDAPAPSNRFAWQVVAHGERNGSQLLLRSARAPSTALAAAPAPGFTDVTDWRVFGTRFPGGRMLYVAQTLEERRETQLEVFIHAGLVTLAIALLAHLWLRARVRHELAPLQILADRLTAFEPLAPGATLGPADRIELVPVHAAIDALAAGLARRVAHERAFAAHAAHALRTPLAGIDAQLAVALRDCAPSLEPRLQRARVAAARLQRLVGALLALFRSGVAIRREPLALAELLGRLPVEGLIVDVSATEPIVADSDLVTAALLNLLDNALRHGATEVRVTTPSPDTLVVHDDGPGIDDERRRMLQHALDVQDYEGATGLGLMLADLVARAHGGALALLDTERGFGVELRLA